MTVRFAIHRIAFYVAIFLLCGVVLGLAGHQASIFLPDLHVSFTIFALVIPALTIFSMLISLQFAQPQTEIPLIFILWALWLAMAAWATDIISFVQCDALTTETIPTKNGGTIRQRSYCYEMKVIQAFSWMIFVLFTAGWVILMNLIAQAQRLGRMNIWREPIQELGWFGEMPGYYNTAQPPAPPASMYPAPQFQGYGYSQNYAQPQPVYQISQGPHGTQVTQVPVVQVPQI
ncbi:hypothetical protein MKEN_00103000 [Mycena kentingensis (nom. inval.)]|nr:hypothetical protein MKEN_00103000 [Mycena kentingensis (nom. inval.)]